MRVQIIAVGRKMPPWVDQAYQEDAKRLPAHYAVTLSCIPTANRKSGTTVAMCQQQEADKILHKIKPGSLTLALDEHGSQWTTEQWAQYYRQWSLDYSQVNFVIGGPDGLAPDILNKAAKTIALGRMTMPHGLVRVVLIEQLYRVWSLVEGHPYHRS